MVKQCDQCKGYNTKITTRNVGNWPYIWYCLDCGASVGCKSDTTEALGFMALGEMRYLRRIAHIYFDEIWLTGLMTRERAKRWMQELLELDTEFHISRLGFRQLKDCINYSISYLSKKTKKKSIEQLKVNYNDRKSRPIQRTSKLNAIHARTRRRKRR
jgi:hypothetical protein